jgi:hypothetical protein
MFGIEEMKVSFAAYSPTQKMEAEISFETMVTIQTACRHVAEILQTKRVHWCMDIKSLIVSES